MFFILFYPSATYLLTTIHFLASFSAAVCPYSDCLMESNPVKINNVFFYKFGILQLKSHRSNIIHLMHIKICCHAIYLSFKFKFLLIGHWIIGNYNWTVTLFILPVQGFIAGLKIKFKLSILWWMLGRSTMRLSALVQWSSMICPLTFNYTINISPGKSNQKWDIINKEPMLHK